MTITTYLLIICSGIVCGFLNSMASSGSAVTLPLLIFLGIPPAIANGSNRLSIFIGSCVAVSCYAQKAEMHWKRTFIIALPVLIGTLIGTLIAVILSPTHIVAVIIASIFIALIILLSNPHRILDKQFKARIQFNWMTYFLFLLIGIYSGLIMLGSAIWMLLGVVLLGGLDLVSANGTKNFLLIISSLLSLIIFYDANMIDWNVGIGLSIGSVIGSFIGGKMGSNPKYKIWIFRLLVIMVALELISLMVKII